MPRFKKKKKDNGLQLTSREYDIINELRGKGDSKKARESNRSEDKPKKKLEKRKDVPQPKGSKSGILPEQPCAMMFCGLSKSGKSTLLKDTLTDKSLLGGYFHTIVMMSPTADCDTTITEALKLPDEIECS
jgi:hypothetical protein